MIKGVPVRHGIQPLLAEFPGELLRIAGFDQYGGETWWGEVRMFGDGRGWKGVEDGGGGYQKLEWSIRGLQDVNNKQLLIIKRKANKNR